MRFRGVLILVCVIVLLAVVLSSLVTRIPPAAMTLAAMTETKIRIHMYTLDHRDYPENLNELPKRDGYMNRTTDGWGRPLIYSVSDNGIISLMSLGRDGVDGGSGEDEDVTRRYRTQNSDGTLNIDDELWTVNSEIVDADKR